MTVTYPQCAVVLKVVWEDFGTKAASLQDTYVLEVLPKSCRVSLNNYKEADEFDLELDYRAFPFDPRLIRSCQVSIHIENMLALVDMNGSAMRIHPRGPETGDDHNTVFMGFVDTGEIELDDDSKIVKLRGRDFTSLYTDIKWNGRSVNLSKPVDEVFTEIISKYETTGDIVVENRSGISPLPVPAKSGVDLGELAGKRNSSRNESVWDVIQDIANKTALLAYIELDKLVIDKPRFFQKDDRHVNFFYGHNIKNISFERKLGRMKGFNIRVRAVIGKEVKVVDIPKQSKNLDIKGDHIKVVKQKKKGQKVEGAQEEEVAPFFSFAVSNIADENALILKGESIFIEMSRQQIEGKFTTFEMESFDNYRNVIDLTKIRNGAAVAIDISPVDMAAMKRVSTNEERVKYLTSRGYATKAATAIAENFGRFSTPFYVRDVEMSFSAQNGWRLEVSFINRIEVKE